ncbi:MAG: hypothetical protein LC749_20815 [Actinobacteria bacterium]|nr:hypothetical protein [Actinomycetota bacterium]
MGRVVDLEREQVEALARQLVPTLRERGSVVANTAGLGDVDRWRKAARRAGRMLGWRVRTGLEADGARVWAASDDFQPSPSAERAAIEALSRRDNEPFGRT